MKEYSIIARFILSVSGKIEIPEEVINEGNVAIDNYVSKHYNKIKFDEPECDLNNPWEYDVFDEDEQPVIECAALGLEY